MEKIPFLCYNVAYPVSESIKKAKEFADGAVTALVESPLWNQKPINVWVRGSSGAILGSLFCYKLVDFYPSLRVNLLYLKKEEEVQNSHWGNIGLNYSRDGINIILDDFIDTGNTLNTIYKTIITDYADIKTIDAVILAHGSGYSNLNFIPDYYIYGTPFV